MHFLYVWHETTNHISPDEFISQKWEGESWCPLPYTFTQIVTFTYKCLSFYAYHYYYFFFYLNNYCHCPFFFFFNYRFCFFIPILFSSPPFFGGFPLVHLHHHPLHQRLLATVFIVAAAAAVARADSEEDFVVGGNGGGGRGGVVVAYETDDQEVFQYGLPGEAVIGAFRYINTHSRASYSRHIFPAKFSHQIFPTLVFFAAVCEVALMSLVL